MAQKRYPLRKRFNAALSERAYEKLRQFNDRYHYGNNYLLTILLENLDSVASTKELDRAFEMFAAEYGSPSNELKPTNTNNGQTL